MPFIEAEHLKYRYPHTDRLALDDISFQIEKGEFIGILGANKAGKSTLCQAFTGLVPNMFRGAYGGRICIDGMEAAKTPVSKLCRKAGLVFQNPFNQLSGAADTVFTETAFGLQNFGVPREEIFSRVEESLRMMDMWAYRDRNPFDLSGGQVQRTAIASVLAMQPEILILDEPTSQLDPQGSEEVFRVVDCLAQTGITIVMVEHKLEKLASYCSKLLLLDAGKQLAFDTPEAVFSAHDMDALGVGVPVYTQVCRTFSVCRPDGLFPVTLEGTLACAQAFPAALRHGTADTAGTTGRARTTDSAGTMDSTTDFDAKPENAARIGVEPVLEASNLSFSYTPEQPVLSDLSLKLYPGATAIVGQNGAGKTTLVRILKGLLKPQAGRVLFDGQDTAGQTVAQLAGKIGYVFQNPDDQIFKNRLLDEVMVGPLNIGMSREQAKGRACAALERLGLSDMKDKNPYDLDLSERKFAAIASVLAMDTDVLILDEPTIAQDAAGKQRLGGLIRALCAEEKTVIAILHDMDFAAQYFDRVIVMAHGKLLADGKPETVFEARGALEQARLEQPHVLKLCEAMEWKARCMTVDALKIYGKTGC